MLGTQKRWQEDLFVTGPLSPIISSQQRCALRLKKGYMIDKNHVIFCV